METENTSPQLLNMKTVQPLQLLEEIIEEILSRLPVKTLLRFKCVSKAWLYLIGSDRFIKIHLRNSRENQTYARWRVIFNFHTIKQCSFRSYLDEQKINPSPVDDPINDHLMTGRVVGSCNGILCILKERCFFLWNPATRICRELPKIGSRIKGKYGFGWDERSGAYNVFVGVSDQDNDQRIGKVYSSKTDSWKTVEHGHHALCCGTGKLECGKIHWLTSKGDYIESFDFETEEFGRIELPSKPEVAQWLWEKMGTLSVVCNNNSRNSIRRFWVMKKYGVKESWVEVEKETWVEVISQPCNSIYGCNGGFFYIESLVSPPPHLIS